ncbi:hypothetical protein AVEN_58935-1 [Araneus ventricosus]|uniref:DUF19 domain-containing protein n=1 Tax=Araneus ventricosus TaxID=182803 RepID=A0A4Y2EPB9_ARAVE|nr:hypothetical protein AVEN_58935-1 [Araneus ventricosus]
MTSWVLAFAASVAVVVTATSHQQDDDEENGQDNEWRKVMCEKQDDSMYQDMNACFQLESQLIRNATASCITKILPESNGTTIELFHAACEDKSLFLKFDGCFGEYESEEEFKKQEEISPEVKACYVEVVNKHDLQELMHYFEES